MDKDYRRSKLATGERWAILAALLLLPVFALASPQTDLLDTLRGLTEAQRQEVRSLIDTPRPTTTTTTTTTAKPTPAPAAASRVIFDCAPPNGCYLAPELTAVLELSAQASGCDIVVVHAGAPFSVDWNHYPGDIDIRYQLRPDGSLDAERTARMLLAILDRFPAIQRSTLPNPTPRQRLSAALSEYGSGNHESHAHVPLLGGQIVVSPEVKRAVLEAAGRMS